VKPRFVKCTGDPWELSWSANASRRHLPPGSLAAYRLDWEDSELSMRMMCGILHPDPIESAADGFERWLTRYLRRRWDEAKQFTNIMATGNVLSDYDAEVLVAQFSGVDRDFSKASGLLNYSFQVSHGQIRLQDGSSYQATDMTGNRTEGHFNKVRVQMSYLEPWDNKTDWFINFNGQVVNTSLVNNVTMKWDVQDWAAGNYFVRCTSPKGTVTKTFVVSH
jgi:hypothetical protein